MNDKITKALETVNELHGETLEAMCDNEIMQKLGWMSGVLADSGYGEQAGDVMRAMVFIHEQAQEIAKLRAALKLIAETYNKPTTSKDGLAFIAATALKETEHD